MGLFGFGKKKQAEQTTCGCGTGCSGGCSGCGSAESSARVKVLGGGCAKCNELEAATVAALEQLGMDTAIEHVTDFEQIAAFGVMTTPALVFDQTVLSYGRVLKTEEIVELLKKVQNT